MSFRGFVSRSGEALKDILTILYCVTAKQIMPRLPIDEGNTLLAEFVIICMVSPCQVPALQTVRPLSHCSVSSGKV